MFTVIFKKVSIKKASLLSLLFSAAVVTCTFGQATVTQKLYFKIGNILNRVVPTSATAQVTAALTKQTATITGSDFYNTGPTGSTVGTLSSSTTFTPSGVNRLMLVSVGSVIGANNAVSSVTFGTTTLTNLGQSINGTRKIEYWYLVNPSTTAANITINWPSGQTLEAAVGIVLLSNVDQEEPFGPLASNNGTTSTSILNVTSAPGDIVIETVAVNDNAINIGSGQTQIFATGTNSIDIRSSSKPAESGSATQTSMSWSAINTSGWSTLGLAVKGVASDANFLLSPELCLDYTIKAGTTITVTAHANVASGTVTGATIPYHADLTSGGNNIFNFTVAQNSGLSTTGTTGTLTWTGTRSTDTTILAGEVLELEISSDYTDANLEIEFDAVTKASFVSLPSTTYVDVQDLDIYDAPYPGGNIISATSTSSTVYIRTVVSNPFGKYDINRDSIIISETSYSLKTIATKVDSTDCTKTYEYQWTSPSTAGNYSIKSKAFSGTEGLVADSLSTSIDLSSDYNISKVVINPASGPYEVDDIITYRITITSGAATITTLPLIDYFDISCLEYIGASIPPNLISSDTIKWNNLGPLAGSSTQIIDTYFKVIANCNPATNTAEVIDAFAGATALPDIDAPREINIDAPPVANDDDVCVIPGSNTIAVLNNDTDADLAGYISANPSLYTVAISLAPSKGTATVNPDKTIDFNTSPGTWIENEYITFSYTVSQAGFPASTGVVTVQYSGVSEFPTANRDNAAVYTGNSLNIDILSNDIKPEGSYIVPTIQQAPSYGTYTINDDFTVTYIPFEGYSGADTIIYNSCIIGCHPGTRCDTSIVIINVLDALQVCKQNTSSLINIPQITDADTYVWTLPAGAVPNTSPPATGTGPYETTTNYISVNWTGVAAGTYDVCAQGENECGLGTQLCLKVIVSDVTLSGTPSNVLCYGEKTGSIDLTVTNGLGGYTYNWTGPSGYTASIEDITNLGAGTYNVTVTDQNGCIKSTFYAVTQPVSALTATASVTNAAVYPVNDNGSIDLTPAGGTPGLAPNEYTYQWSNGATTQDISGLGYGIYTVTITDNAGCSLEKVFTVNNVGAPLSSYILKTDVLCSGISTGTIDLEVTGGAINYSYTWSGPGGFSSTSQDLTGLSTGTYNVTINDAGDGGSIAPSSIIESVVIEQPALALSVTSIATNSTCLGFDNGSVNASPVGGTTPYTYLWSTGEVTEDINDLNAGTYTLTVTDANGCTATTSKTITQPTIIELTTDINFAICGDSSGDIDLSVTGGTAPYTFDWSNGSTSENLNNVPSDEYAVVVTDANGCTAGQVFVVENSCLGISKALVSTPVNHGDGTYTLTYNIKFENLGSVLLNNIQATETLTNTFPSPAFFSAVSLSSGDYVVNNLFNGSTNVNLINPSNLGTLSPGSSRFINLSLTVTPGTNLGPYNNSVFASATDPNSQSVSDTSDNGTDTDNDDDNNPNETGDNDPTPVTFTENPVIGLAKELLSGPTNNLDGSYDITFRFKVRNLGDVNLSNIQITDNLLTTFGASSTITNINVNSSDLTVNGAYNGTSNVNLLSGTDPLLIDEVNTVELSFKVIPSSAGPFTNSAQSTGTSPAGIQASDTSDNGSVVDADNDGNADETGENDPTPITFPENPQIGLSKRLIGTPVNHYDGSYSLTYTFTIENSGDVPLSNIQLADNLVTTFGNVPIVITSLTSSTFSTNGSYTGIAPNTNLLTGSNTLAVGASGSITLVVRVTPGNLGPFNNSATVTATSPFNAAVSDISQDGSDIDPENDGPADNLVPTPASLTENPEISVAKYISSGPVSNQNGTYTMTYAIILSNTGDVVLTNVQLKDTLSKTFTGATGFTVNNVTATGSLAVNSGFTGTLPNVNLLNNASSTLAFGEIDTVFITLTVTPGSNLGPYLNLAEASGDSPSGSTVTDKSETGTDPDPDGDGDPSNNTTPTPVTFTENPAIDVTKTVGVVTEPFPSTYSFSYTMVLENTGDIRLNNVQLTDDLLAAFPAPNTVTLINPILVSSPSGSGITINTNFNGDTDKNLLNGTGFLMPGQTVTVNLALFVNSPSGGIYTNTALALGTSPANQLVMNYDEVDVAFDAQPSIGIAKDVYSVTDIAPPANTTFDIIVELTLENLGNTPLSNLEIYDDIVMQFAGMSPTNFATLIPADISPTDPAYNFLSGSTGWDGSASSNILAPGQELAIGQTGTVWVKFRVTPGSTGYVDNSATANGTDPTGTEVTDISQDGLNPDPDNDDDGTDNNVPTPITFPIGADLAVTKTVNNPTPNIGGTVIFTIDIENMGPVDATGVELTDILPNGYTFVSASTSAGSYDSGTGIWTIGNLNLDASETLMITATVNQPGVGVIYVNTASVTDSDQNDPVLSNNSDNDTVTPVSSPGISIVKSSSLNKGVDGVPSVGDLITYTYTVSNTGDVTLFSVGVTESVATFTGTGTLPSPVFQSATLSSPDGTLLVSEVATYTATYAITQADINSGRIDNQALATGTSYSGQTVNDNSDTGNTADPNETGGSNDPTATLIDALDLVIEKSSASETFTSGGTVTWTIVVSNNGPSNVTGATVVDNFVSGLSNISWTAVPSGTASVSNLSGTGNINETVNINVGAANYVTFTINATVASNFTGNLTNTVNVSAPSGFAEINTSNNSDTETDTPLYESDLEITKVSSSSTFTPGSTVTWTITVNNNGPSDVTNAIVSDNFDSRLTDIQWTATASGSASVVNTSGNGDIVNELVSIAAGASNYITYTVTADVPSDYNDLTLINTASVEVPAGTTDPDLTNNDDTETDNILREADLYITKTSASNTYTPGSTVTYNIIIGNNGPSDILAATFSDTAPTGTSISNWTAIFSGGSSGSATGSGNINQTVGLPVGATISYDITLNVSPNFTGDLTNTATIATTGTDTDPDLSNNSDSETDIQAPVAVNDSFITAYETMINNGSVAPNDNYPLNSVFSNISSSSSGTLIFNADGTFDYTPAPGFSGVVTFDYKICLPSPDDSVCDTATVTIVVGPNADDDNYTTPYETPVTSNVNANDEYPLGSTFAKLTDPANGDVVFSPNGSFIYTPDPGFSGVNTFTYQVCLPSPNGTVCESATVTIVVGPNAEDDNEITPFATILSDHVRANDTYPVNSNFTLINDIPTGQGSLTFNSDGSYTYDPGTFAGTTSFSYSVCMPSPNQDMCDIAIVTITVPCPNVTLSVATFNNPLCEAGQTGSITLSVSNGVSPYTYTWPHDPLNNLNTATGLYAGTYTITVTDANGCTDQVSQILVDPSGITATISGLTMVSCTGGSNGSATVTGSGGTGTGTYTYEWSTVPAQTGATATGLTAGSYSVTVTDGNGCSAVAFVVITQPTGMVAHAVEVNAVSCNGASDGSARIDVTGGVTPYAYNWPGNPIGDGTPNATGLAAGDYTITITDANLCTTTAIVTIGEGITLQISNIDNIGPICKGSEIGDILLESAPFNENINYSWTGGALAGLQDGTASGLNPYIPGFVAVNLNNITATVTVTASLQGCTSSTDFTILILDSTDPTFINCPPSGTIFTVGQFTNDCNSGAIWNIPLASDNCGVSVLQTLGPVPGTILGVGLYNIQYTASDLAGNTAVCNFGIQVIDTEDPIIVCPGNILINHTNITECTWESPIGSLTPLLVNSNCPSLVSWSITNPDATINTGLGDASGYIFELGTSNVVYRITEPASGQFWTCSFNVIVTDNTPPTIICPEDLTIECGDTQQSQKIEDWIETATLLDACDNTLNVQASIFSTDSKCGATQTLLYRFVTFDDAGNSSECFANVHIVDTTSPQISGGNDVAINDCTDPNFGNYPEFDFWLTSHAGATATDLCGNVTWSNNYNPVNWVEQCGITKYVDVIFTARDECGNVSSTTKRFSIGDTEAPTFINCPRPPIIEYAPEGWAATFVNYAPMLATDNCGGVIITQIDGTGYSSGSLFPVGLTTLIFEAEDDCGNTSRCQLQIVVNDYHTPPSFNCGQDITVSTDPQECFATLNNLPPLNITDNAIQNVTAVYGIEHAGEVIASGINVANGNQFPKGVSTVTYRVKDQVLLKITEVIHDGTISGVEITNFGPAKYDISFLNIERVGFLPENFVVPNGIILNVGDTYTHNFSAIPAGIPIAYQISFLNNLIDGVALNGYVPTTFSWSGQINGNYAIRTRILDLDIAQDFEVTTPCDNGNYGLLNPGIPTYNWNGTTTSLQSEEPSEITCTFRVTVLDQELPFCAQYDTLRYQGVSDGILSTQCNTSSVQINSHFEIGDINIKNLNGSYPDMGDITIQLVSPSGKKVKLLDRMCTGTQNFNINLDDESLQLLSGAGCNPLGQGGTFKPLESMKPYLGEDAFGTWTIEIYSAGNQSGSIDGWTLEILEVESFQQQNVTIPNIIDICGASYTWNHALVGDNCFEGTIRVDYSTLDGISVPVGQTLSGKGGYINTQYFQVGTTTVTYTVTDAVGLVSTCSFDVTVEDVQDPVILAGTCEDITINLPPGDCYASYIYPTASFADNCSGAFATYSIPSGSDFGIGQTIVTATIQDLAGNFVTCQFVVEVIEFTPTNSTMVCNGEVNLSLDKNCMAWLNADMFLEGDHYRCYDSYCIIIKDQLGNIIGSSANNTHFFDLSHVGKSFYVSVCESCDIQNSNCCWSLVNIEEKLIPEVVCPEDITIQCNGNQDPSVTGYPELMTCEPDISINYTDEYIDGEACNNPRAIINRLWIIKDEAGHEVLCNQNIVVMPFDLDMVEFPDDLVLSEALSCVDVEEDPSLTTPANTGYPTIQGQDLYGEHLCEFNVGFRDEVLDDANCLNGYEILRHWSIRNECQPLQEGVNPRRHIQAIKVNDKSSPVFKNCPDDITINTLPYACTGQYLLENVSEMAEDACGDIKKIQVNLTGGSVSKPSNGQDDYMLFNMEVGHHNVRIRVFDACKNVATCNFNIYVKDETAPYAIGDQLLTVSLIPLPDGTSQARLNAISVDDGSYDNCGEVKFEIRRESGSPTCGNVSNNNVNNNWTFNNDYPILHENDHIEDSDGGDYVTFCCQDLYTGVDMDGDGNIDTGYHRVYLRVWDDGDQDGIFGSEGDQFNEVQAYVRVENKIPPIVRCPSDATINCDSNPFIFETLTVIQNQDLSLTGMPQVISLCGDAILRVLDSKSVNNCGIGFITRQFTVNQGSYTHQCTQRITMEIPSSHTPWTVFAPSANAVEVGCNGPTLDEIATYGPTWVGGPCDNIGITHTVNTFLFDGQSCKKWLVEYSLINWCNNELRGPYQRVFVHKDTIAPVIQQCSDRQFQAGQNCAIQSLILKNMATDNVSCNSTDQIKWVVTIDINNDGIKDFEWSSYLTPGDDVQDAANGNINLITDDNGNGIPDIYVAPTASGSEVSIQIPVALQASIQYHQVDWRATDGCNNTSACQHQILVTDQKAPTAICSAISTAFMRDPDGNGPMLSMVELKAKSFDQGSNDQCTPINQLYFTFEEVAPQHVNKLVFGKLININVPHYFDRSGGLLKYPADLTDPAQNQIVQNYLNGIPASVGNGKIQFWNPDEKTSSMVWTVSELPTGTGVLSTSVRMTVWDAALNGEYCASNLRITCQDCPGFLLTELSGSARTIAMNGVKNVYVITEGINVPELIVSTQTDSTGQFAIDVPKGVSYKLSALKNGSYMEGVSTLDLVLISRHMLGIDTFDSPFTTIAADIDNNNKINSADLVMLRKLILGLTEQLPNLSWRLPVRQQNLDIFEPFPYQEYIIIDSLSQSVDDNHFVAVKIGDVNGSAKTDIIGATAEPRNNHALILKIEDKEVNAGETIYIPVTSDNYREVMGHQFTLDLNHATFEGMLPGALEISNSQFGKINTQKVTFSYDDAFGTTLPSDQTLFTLILKVQKNAKLSEMVRITSEITSAEAYFEGLSVVSPLRLVWKKAPLVSTDIILHQNEPNPFVTSTSIGFEIPMDGQVTINIFSVQGQLIHSRKIDARKGINTEVFTAEQIGDPGLYYYELSAFNKKLGRKLVRIE